jgi:hypothetical protein
VQQAVVHGAALTAAALSPTIVLTSGCGSEGSPGVRAAEVQQCNVGAFGCECPRDRRAGSAAAAGDQALAAIQLAIWCHASHGTVRDLRIRRAGLKREPLKLVQPA